MRNKYIDSTGLSKLWTKIKSTFATKTELRGYHDASKQDNLTAGENITIDSNNVISAAGNIDDVKVDGISVVNNRVANIPLQPIKDVIPAQASSSNQLADKDFVNSSISTNTAAFKGTFDNLETLKSTSADNNDYAFYSHTDSLGNTVFDRYKYSEESEEEDNWEYEYSLNNSSFTAEQWSTINSGLTSQVSTDVSSIMSKIPALASSSNQLADKDFVNSSISTNTATYISDDGEPFTSLSKLQSANGDKNDYAFYKHLDDVGNTVYDRYKYVGLAESELPEEYTELKYIISTNTFQYIDTGITPTADTNLDITFIYNNASELSAQCHIVSSGVSRNINFGIEKEAYVANMHFGRGGGRVDIPLNSNVEYHVEMTSEGLYINGMFKGVLPSLSSSTGTITLFNHMPNGSSPYNQWSEWIIKIGKVKITNNDEVVMHLIPAQDSVGKIGFYDLVTKTFKISNGSQQFTKENLSADKWKLEYRLNNSSFTAEQWAALNSGITSSSLSGKQDALVSGTNIKTINGQSILGSGDIQIKGGAETISLVNYTEEDISDG